MEDTTREELEALAALASALNEVEGLEQALTVALERLTAFFGLETGWIWLMEDGAFVLAAAQALPEAFVEDPSWSSGQCTCQREFDEGGLDAPQNTAVLRCSRLSGLEDGTRGLGFHISVPLRASHRPLGVLNLASRSWRKLEPRELRVMGLAGEVLAAAIDRAYGAAERAERAALSERVRVARELHDTVVQELVGLTMMLETLEATAPGALVTRSLESARRSLRDARQAVLELREDPLGGRALAPALEAMVARGFSGRPERARVEVLGEPRALSARARLGLYRIAQEATSNARRHAGAREVVVRLGFEEDRVVLEVEDDGVGPVCLEGGEESVGLMGMRERASLLGGRLEVGGEAGVCVRVEIPWEAP